ncbi:rap ran GTPase-activating protein putative [Entamoeba histolytica]|uniref:Rap ran GTPase-activating protein putative n=1 Tax=Entamoeba histolytica TaxID=5759 RepID=A0A175JKI5_ENTHI|nr:rap ran GTPase-activating protein putative [Entamoeba histolytica]
MASQQKKRFCLFKKKNEDKDAMIVSLNFSINDESTVSNDSPTHLTPRTPKTPKSSLAKSSGQSFAVFEDTPKHKSTTNSVDFTMLNALKDIIGVGTTDIERTRSAMEQLKEMFASPSDAVISTLVPNVLRPNKKYITKESVYYVIMDSLRDSQNKIYDCWSSLQLPIEVWTGKYTCFNVIMDCAQEKEFAIETDIESTSRNFDLFSYDIINIDDDFTFFKQFFYLQPKTIFYVFPENATILCYQKTQKIQFVMSFRPSGLRRFILPKNDDCSKWWIKTLNINEKPIKSKNNIKLQDQLMKLETQLIVKNYKFGVLYAKPGQKTEDEMYSNTECSSVFWKFMDLIASKKEQLNWNRFIGGLDSKNGRTGEYFYFSFYEKFSYEIVFHVAPLLPDNEGSQKLERKRHIGNDIVVIVFKEMVDSTDTFDPRCITSHFNHIFIVVTPEKNDETNEIYHVNVVCKSEILPFPPFLETSVFHHDIHFKQFLTRKLLNAERTAMNCGIFVNNSVKSNERIIKHIISSSLE